jgi:hypothetical protein
MKMFALFVLGLVTASCLVSGQASLSPCGSALQPVFSAAQGYQCVQLTITGTNFNTSAVSYSQGNLYYNRYYDGLVNRDVPSFPVVSNAAVSCNQGISQLSAHGIR